MTDLSIVIPCYNEERRINNAVYSARLAMVRAGIDYEIILVVNGSEDETWAHAVQLVGSRVIALWIDERGKGIAVKRGMLEARGKWRLMADCDWAMPADYIPVLYDLRTQADVIIGRRYGLNAVCTEPTQRRISAWVFNRLVRLITGLDWRDTQCGYKLFSVGAAQDIFSRLQSPGLAFDVEVLMLAERLHYRIIDPAIVWTHNGDSRVRLWSDSLAMLRDVWQIRRRLDNTPINTPTPGNAPTPAPSRIAAHPTRM
jgi:dolichyl-phosphate beta-glucosyltransferase